MRVYRGLSILGGATPCTLNSLRVTQNSALRAVFGLCCRDGVASLRRRHRILTIESLYNRRIALLAYKSFHGPLTPALSSTPLTPHSFATSLRLQPTPLDVNIDFSRTS